MRGPSVSTVYPQKRPKTPNFGARVYEREYRSGDAVIREIVSHLLTGDPDVAYDTSIHQHILTLSEAAALLRFRPITVRRLVARGLLPRIHSLRHIRIPAAAIDTLAANQPVRPDPRTPPPGRRPPANSNR